jgi:hypothetical protein
MIFPNPDFHEVIEAVIMSNLSLPATRRNMPAPPIMTDYGSGINSQKVISN